IIFLTCCCFAASDGARDLDKTEIVVITKADDRTIRRIIDDWRKHQEKVSCSSLMEPYFDCDAHRELLEYGPKAAPYLIAQLARHHRTEPYIGAALINDPNITTVEQVGRYNERRKSDLYNQTLAHWILTGTLSELITPEEKRKTRTKVRIEPIDWMEWWKRNERRFLLERGVSPGVALPRYKRLVISHISTSARNGLLDFCAVSATYRQMIEHAAAEMGVETFIGRHTYMDIIGTVWMKSVTYEEFLYMVGRSVYILGFDYRKTENGYWVGGEKRAEPRAILTGWGLKMERTVFHVGEDIPVTVITRGIPDPANVSKDVYVRCGSFRITKNDDTVVKEYSPKKDDCSTAPPANRTGALHEVELLLNGFAKLEVGEYNIRYRYREFETPTVAIEIYPKDAKAVRPAPPPKASRTKTENQ
ncbi:MAG: hypothetical protein ACYS8Z_10855, partial [Planctomycetota bacterium]